VMGGNQKSCGPISPGRYTVRLAGSDGRYTGRGPATFPLRVRIEYGQPGGAGGGRQASTARPTSVATLAWHPHVPVDHGGAS
jgi:hypothetical protein